MSQALPRLYVVADLDYVGDAKRWLDVLAALDSVAERQPLAIQIRAKQRDRQALAAVAEQARRAVAHASLVLNGPPALAVALGCDGVHWPEANIPSVPDVASSGAGGRALAFRTAAVHNAAAVAVAERAGANGLVFAPVFRPTWKPATARGLDALRRTVAAASQPVFALGGVTPERVAACIAAGAHGVAALGGVLGAPDPTAAAVDYLEALLHAGTGSFLARGTPPRSPAEGSAKHGGA